MSEIPVTVIDFPLPTFSLLKLFVEVVQSIATYDSSPEITPLRVGAEQLRVAVVFPLNCLLTPRTPETVMGLRVTSNV